MSKESVFCYKVNSPTRKGTLIFLDFKNIESFIGGETVMIEKVEIGDGSKKEPYESPFAAFRTIRQGVNDDKRKRDRNHA